MDRIQAAFTAGKENQRALFVAFVCACDPDEDTSYAVCRQLIESGVDLLELGIPFTDPLADGLTNQLAAERALAAGATQAKVFRLVERLRATTEIPIIFYTYYNLVCAGPGGVEAYVQRAKAVGVDGLLTLDLPPEEAGDLLAASAEAGLKNVFIIAPTTPPARIAKIAAAASGFLYYVSREGVTGVREGLAEGIGEALERIRAATDLPVVVGFGINSRAQVATVAALADGVVVGSALVNCIPANAGNPAGIVAAIKAKMEDLVAGLADGQKTG